MRSPPWRVPRGLTRGGICERFASIVISICMDERFPIRKYLSGKKFVRLENHRRGSVNIMREKTRVDV